MSFQYQCLKLFPMSSIFLHGVLHKHRGNLRCDSYVPTIPSCKLYLITFTPVVSISFEWVSLCISTLSESVFSSVCDAAGICLLESCSGWLSHPWALLVVISLINWPKEPFFFFFFWVDLSQAGPAQMLVPQASYGFSSPSDQCYLNFFSLEQGWLICSRAHGPQCRKFSENFSQVWKPGLTSTIFVIISVLF